MKELVYKVKYGDIVAFACLMLAFEFHRNIPAFFLFGIVAILCLVCRGINDNDIPFDDELF